MKTLIAVLLCAGVAPAIHADTATYYSPGGASYDISNGIPAAAQDILNAANVSLSVIPPTASLGGNSFTLYLQSAFDITYGTGDGGYFSQTFSDTYKLPNAPAGDLVKVTLNAYGAGDCSDLTFAFSPGPASPGFCENNSLGTDLTVPASQITTITLQGGFSGSLDALGETPAKSGTILGQLEIDRFKSDGVTPDPFTTAPEPASLALLGLGGLTILRWRRGSR